ncbi:MAG: hypothetical protein ACLUE2_14595 [Bacteroides cellulosilyticus]
MTLFSPRVSVRQPMLPVMMYRQQCCSKLPEREGDQHNGVRCRYTAQDGIMTEDRTFGPGDDFAITDSRQLTEFIRWSAEKYPNRHYILVIGGHGSNFTPYNDLKEQETPPSTRATLVRQLP